MKKMRLSLGMNSFTLTTVYYVATLSDSPPQQCQKGLHLPCQGICSAAVKCSATADTVPVAALSQDSSSHSSVTDRSALSGTSLHEIFTEINLKTWLWLE